MLKLGLILLILAVAAIGYALFEIRAARERRRE
jgi:hypothetical protein